MRLKSGFQVVIITAAMSVMWLVSCSKPKVTQGTAITMGISEKGTKAVVDDKESLITQSLTSGTGFGVYGYKTVRKTNPDNSVTNTETPIFTNTEVQPATNSADTEWRYSPLRYWDSNPNASYQFIAYWPHLGNTSGSGAYVTETGKVLTIHDVPCWQDGSLAESADFMTAERVGSYYLGDFNVPTTDGTTTKVRFTFSHILAKLEIRGYYIGVKENHVNITGIRLTGTGILSTNGTVSTYTQPFGQDGTPAFSTPPTSNATHVLYDPVNDDDQTNDDGIELPETAYAESENSTPESYEPICVWLMVPCSYWNSLGLEIDFGIGGSSPNTSRVSGLTLSTGDLTGQTLSGRSYIVNLRFDSSGGGVDLQSVVVKEWETRNINSGVYNW